MPYCPHRQHREAQKNVVVRSIIEATQYLGRSVHGTNVSYIMIHPVLMQYHQGKPFPAIYATESCCQGKRTLGLRRRVLH